MKKLHLCGAAALASAAVFAQGEKLLLDFTSPAFEPARVFHADGDAAYEMPGDGSVKLTIQPNNGWQGLYVSIPNENRDLSAFGGVSVNIHNPGDFPQFFGVRVDNPGADGSKNCNGESFTLQPGETKDCAVWFGFGGGQPAFQLNPKNVTTILVYWHQPQRAGSLVLRDCKAIPPNPTLTALLPREKLVISFGAEGVENLFKMDGGVLVEGADAIGEKSLLGDNAADPREWFEFWETKPGLVEGSHTYNVKFQCRVLDADAGAKFYSFFRSHSRGWGKWDRAWKTVENLAAIKGQTLTQEYTVDLPRFKDYKFMLGINGGKAKIVFDNIEITRGAPYNEGDLLDRAVAKRNANAEVVHFLNFENGLEGANAVHGQITENVAEVLMGKKSFVADTIGRGQEWTTILTTGRGAIEPGYKYFITIPYRMEKLGDRPGNIYVFAESTRQGDKNYGWRSFSSGAGDDDVIATTFQYREGGPHQLVLGVQHEARVVIDEIEIRREPLPPDLLPGLVARNPRDMKLVFEDTFDGAAIDEAKWHVGGDGPHRGGMLRKANAVIQDGNLHMLFMPDGDTFSSAALNTQGKHQWTYGYFECRAMLNKQEGHWFGFWLMNDKVNNVDDSGRDGTEVDIVEAPWLHEDKASHALHWDGYGDDHATDGFAPAVPGLHEGFHTFAVDWQPDGYIFFIDGKETWRSNSGGVCQNPSWIILSDELGGWSGDARNIDAANFPDRIIVDYVRVWQ